VIPTLFRDQELAFLDLETSGLNPLANGVMQVGICVATPKLILSASYDSLVKPYGYAVSGGALEINGLSLAENQAMGADGGEVAQNVKKMLVGRLPVGQNVKFDLEFLRSFFAKFGVSWDGMPKYAIDTASLAWPLVLAGKLESPSLDKMCTYFEIPPRTGHHDALADAVLTYNVYKKLMA
jgi:DNA polymerase-3 subunit epsilon